MACNHNVKVGHCVVELTPIKQDKQSHYESSPFLFQSSDCRVKIYYAWDTDDKRRIKICVRSNPTLSPNFYTTLSVSKGSHFISYPKKQIQEVIKCIWTLSTSHIEEQLSCNDISNLKFRLEFQQESDIYNSGPQSLLPDDNRCIEKLSEDFATLLEDPKYDIEVISGNIVVNAHKPVLRVRSPFFNKMLQSSIEDRKIELQCIQPAAFQEIMRYMYTGKLHDMNYEVAKNIYKAGNVSNIGFLKEQCVAFLVQNLTVDNACECLTFVNDDLKDRVIDFIIDKDVPYSSEDWKLFCDEHPVLANCVLMKHNIMLKDKIASMQEANKYKR